MGRTLARSEIAEVVSPILAGASALIKGGTHPKSLQQLVDNREKRARAVAYINAGCPELPVELLAGSVPLIDEKFFLQEAFLLTVPTNYIYEIQLESFFRVNRQQFSSVDEGLNDQNFARGTNHLETGKTYLVKLFGVTQRVSSEDCLGLYRTQHGIFTGAQGLTLVWQKAKSVLLSEHSVLVSYDEKDKLGIDSQGRPAVPFVGCYLTGKFNFFVGTFEGGGWYPDTYIIVFCECA